METYYRYEGGPIWEGGTMFIYLIRFNVVKRTPKGAWIIQVESWKPKRRFVLDGDGKRYAYPTQEAAPQGKSDFTPQYPTHLCQSCAAASP